MPLPRPLRGASRLDENGLPSWLGFTRGAGGYSIQTAPAVDGTTFVATGSTQNAPRFSYLAAAGRRLLLVEPTRTNILPDSNFVDAGPNDVPDNWEAGEGAAGTSWNTVTPGAPHGGAFFRIEDVATPDSGVYDLITLDAVTTYAWSAWIRRTGTGAVSVYTTHTNPGIASVALGTAAFDWTRIRSVSANVGAGIAAYMSIVGTRPAGTTISFANPQVEVGPYGSSWIPSSGGAATRAAELCAIDPSVVPASRGRISLLWCPFWANTEVTGTACLFAWGANSRLEFEGTGDTIRVVNESNNRAASAALTFARDTMHRITVDYGSFGTRLTVDGVETVDSNAWVAPTLAPFLGSRAASAACESAGYGDLVMAAA